MKVTLKEIYNHKIELVEFLKNKKDQKELEKEVVNTSRSRGFIKKINNNFNKNLLSIIAEIKKASPSKGIIKESFYPIKIAEKYESGNAACISVLTDNKYFLGKNEDLIAAKNATTIPILRKDFIVSEYQIFESKIIGADCILLISEILDKLTIDNYISLANELDLDVIVEVHGKENFDSYYMKENILLGINNRNLKNMNVDVNHAISLADKCAKNNLICESGISSFEQFQILVNEGFSNFLIGEHFMRNENIKHELLKFSSYQLNNKDIQL
ncbi:MAG: indole-3-glycerol phosphate synthase 2 [Rickettsiales bacterium]|nr:indole-3-glycerol phosphate synthase 2 [Rickettsiales bacterium]OUV80694.1 MAG: hypothetical protein CBC91_02940 [Rickettsiales bacterium TMED131]